jgi:ubiquinone biosynthesis UbiH/UbiF/VisC/COQ6 family hydroxylase
MATLDFDIIIVGGGVAGAACAALLARQDRSVALIDARRPSFPATPGDFDLRVVAISPGSQRVLSAAGAWQHLDPARLAGYSHMQVHAESLSVQFSASDHGLLELGWIAEIPAMEQALWKILEDMNKVSLFAPSRWTSFETGSETVRLTLDDGRMLRANLIVAADGGRSRLRRQAGISVDEWHYNQRALIAPVKTENSNHDLAWQRFTEHGPLALLPLPDGRSSIVWSQNRERAERLAVIDPEQFLGDINQHQDSPLGRILDVGPRRTLPLIRRRSRRLVSHRLVLLGDAARTVHPLAGQGLNLGLMDAAALAEVLEPWREGSPESNLNRYQRWRLSNSTLIGGGIHSINELVRSPAGAGRHVLGAGFGLAARLWPLRESFVARACGIDSDSPRLARTGLHGSEAAAA